MTFEVIILPRAEADMERNARWWAEHHSIAQAVEWFEYVQAQSNALGLAQVTVRSRRSIDNEVCGLSAGRLDDCLRRCTDANLNLARVQSDVVLIDGNHAVALVRGQMIHLALVGRSTIEG